MSPTSRHFSGQSAPASAAKRSKVRFQRKICSRCLWKAGTVSKSGRIVGKSETILGKWSSKWKILGKARKIQDNVGKSLPEVEQFPDLKLYVWATRVVIIDRMVKTKRRRCQLAKNPDFIKLSSKWWAYLHDFIIYGWCFSIKPPSTMDHDHPVSTAM